MRNKIRIVATCSNRKRARIARELSVASLPNDDVRLRCKKWISRLRKAKFDQLRAEELYAGHHWKSAIEIPEAARLNGYSSELWVVSAGYGLFPAYARISPYAATFAAGQTDSVANDVSENQIWWENLAIWDGPEPGQPRTFQDLVESDPAAFILLVASPPYLKAISGDLEEAIKAAKDAERIVIVSTGANSSSSVKDNIVPACMSLRNTVGGTMVSLNARIALKIVDMFPPADFRISHVSHVFKKLIQKQKPLPKYDRITMTDDKVISFIVREISSNPTLTKTPMLRRLRNDGYACEQRRFGLLYQKTLEELYGKASKKTLP